MSHRFRFSQPSSSTSNPNPNAPSPSLHRSSPYSRPLNSPFSSTWRSPSTTSSCASPNLAMDISMERPFFHLASRPQPANRPSFSAQQPLPSHLCGFGQLDTRSTSVLPKPQFLTKSPFPSLTRNLNNEAEAGASTSTLDSEKIQKWTTAFEGHKRIGNQKNGENSNAIQSNPIAGGSASLQKPPKLQAPTFIPFARVTMDVVQETAQKLHHLNLQSQKPSTPASIQMDTGNDNKITLHYPNLPPPPPLTPKPSIHKRPTVVPGVFGYQPAASSSCAPQARRTTPQLSPAPSINTFRGLSTKVYDNSFSSNLTLKLEENYNKCRKQVLSRDGFLLTPYKFLTNVCSRMQLEILSEGFRFFCGEKDVQYRMELFVGGFCGVAHAQSKMMSKQLAAAHVLERMRIHFRTIKPDSYALFPGGRFNKIGDKLKGLCKQYDLGQVQVDVKDRWQKKQRARGVAWQKEDEIRWECSCFVKNYQSVVLSDHAAFGLNLAQKQMFLNFAKPPEVPVIQIQDYFGIGADCPMLKDIHRSLLLYVPSYEKKKWMLENGVPETQMDAVLHDPTNSSRYLLARPGNGQGNAVLEGANLQEFKQGLEDALEWIGRNLRRKQSHGMRMDIEGDSGLTGDGALAQLNADEEQDIFLDAEMDLELE